MLDAVLCELEGVLADVGALRGRAVARALEAEGFSSEGTRCSAYESTRDVVRRALRASGEVGDETRIDLLVLIAEQRLLELVGAGVTLSPGAREAIERFAAQTRLAIVTRASRRVVERVLALAQLDSAFECVIAAEEGGASAPDPRGIARTIDRLRRRRPLRREAVVALVDHASGARAAHDAGVHAIGVGPLDVALLAEADAVIPSLVGQSPHTVELLVASRAERIG